MTITIYYRDQLGRNIFGRKICTNIDMLLHSKAIILVYTNMNVKRKI